MAFSKLGALIERINSTVSSAGTLNLANNSASFQQITGTLGHTIVLPQADAVSPNECPVGLKFAILNRSTVDVAVNTFGGALLATVTAGTQRTFRLLDKTTSTGIWDVTVEAAGAASLSDAEKAIVLGSLATGKFSDSTTETNTVSIQPEAVGGNYWLSVASMNRAKQTDTYVLNGIVYTVTGYDGSNFYTENFAFDTDANKYSSRAPLPITKNEGSYFALDGSGYTAGGAQATTIQSGDGFKYSEANNAWTANADLSPSGHASITAVTNGRAYVIGGYDQAIVGYRGNIRIYNPALNTFYSKAQTIVRGYAPSKCVLEDNIVVAGGNNGVSSVNLVSSYTPHLDAILTKSPMISSKQSSGSSHIGEAYAMAGYTNAFTSSCEKYNIDKNAWEAITPSGTARLTAVNGAASINDGLYIFGGYNPTYLATVERYVAHTLTNLIIKKIGYKAPTAITPTVSVSSVTNSIPMRIRTDGLKWRSFMSGTSVLRGGPTTLEGSNIAVNGTFNTDLSGWSNNGNIGAVWSSTNGGSVNLTRIGSSGAFYQVLTTVPGRKYRFSFDLVSSTDANGTIHLDIRNGSTPYAGTSIYVFSAGKYSGNQSQYRTYTDTFTAVGAQTVLYFAMETVSSWSCIVDNFSVTAAAATEQAEILATAFNPFSSLYVWGGRNGPINTYFNDDQNIWQSKASMPSSEGFGPYCFSLTGVTFIAGDASAMGVSGANNYAYTELTNSYVTKGAPPSNVTYNGGAFSLNGKGYTVGGYTSTSVRFVNSYNSMLNTWTAKGEYPIQVYAPAASSQYGYGFAFAGSTTNNYPGGQQLSYRYNDDNDSWTQIASTGVSGINAAALPLANYIYLAGFQNTSASSTQNNIRYDHLTNSFTSMTSYPTPTSHPAAGLSGGFGFIVGGYNVAAGYNQRYNPEGDTWSSRTNIAVASDYQAMGTPTTGSTYRYELQIGLPTYLAALGGGSWKTNANIQTPRYATSNFSLNGKMQTVNGIGVSNALSTTEEFNPELNTWRYWVTPPLNQTYTMTKIAGELNGHGFHLNGYTLPAAVRINSNFTINGETNTWVAGTSFPYIVNDQAGSTLNGLLYVVGGVGAGGPVSDSYSYSMITSTWTSRANTSANRFSHSCFSVDGNVHALAGATSSGPVVKSNRNDRYNDAGNYWTAAEVTPVTEVYCMAQSFNGKGLLWGGGDIIPGIRNAYEYIPAGNYWRRSTDTPVEASTSDSACIGGSSPSYTSYNNGSGFCGTYMESIKNIIVGGALKVSE